MDIQLVRNNAGHPHVNMEHVLVKKIDSFDWGNTSEAAAELACNILHLYCDELTRERLYLPFMSSVISHIPYSGRTLTQEEIEEWIAKHSYFEDERVKRSFRVAVYRAETGINQIHHVQANTEIEAIIRACESYEKEEYIHTVCSQIHNYDEAYDYYSKRDIYFSEPEFMRESNDVKRD